MAAKWTMLKVELFDGAKRATVRLEADGKPANLITATWPLDASVEAIAASLDALRDQYAAAPAPDPIDPIVGLLGQSSETAG